MAKELEKDKNRVGKTSWLLSSASGRFQLLARYFYYLIFCPDMSNCEHM